MKIYILSIVLAFLLTTSECQEIPVSGGGFTTTVIVYDQPSPSTDYDITVNTTFSNLLSPLSPRNHLTIFCVDTQDEAFTNTEDEDALTAFAVEWWCQSRCNGLHDFITPNGFRWYTTNTASYNAQSGDYQFSQMLYDQTVGFTLYANESEGSMNANVTGVGAAQLANLNLPAAGETAYYRCWMSANSGEIPYSFLGSADVEAELTTGSSNVTFTTVGTIIPSDSDDNDELSSAWNPTLIGSALSLLAWGLM